jgi:hypothetical protein
MLDGSTWDVLSDEVLLELDIAKTADVSATRQRSE